MSGVTRPEMNMHHVFVAVTVRVAQIEPTSTSRNDCGNKKLRDMVVSGRVTLGNDSCNLCRN